MKITAKQIVELLSQKHASDVWIPECKDGPTWGGGHYRLDGWAMKRSWSPLCFVGYEVKVSRSDFVNDDKWPSYLDLCHQLYFVCPAGLIDPVEVPEQCGLICVSKTGTRLYTKKKAPHREIQPPGNLMAYALMRADRFTPMHNGDGLSREEKIRDWLSEKDRKRNLGQLVNQRIAERIHNAEAENHRLKCGLSRLSKVKALLDELGIDPDNYRVEDQLKTRLSGELPTELRFRLERVVQSAQDLLSGLDKVTNAEAPDAQA